MPSSRKSFIASWIMQLVVAFILLQTLYYKFTGAEESRHIFETLGLEPWGRIGTGVAELVAGALILIPATVTLGAILALALMGGAIVGHLTQLGIVVMNDGGLLFGMAVLVFLCSLMILIIRRSEIPLIGSRL